MLSDTFTIGRIFGIRLALSPSWLIVFAMLVIGLAGIYFPAAYPHWPTAVHWMAGLTMGLLFTLCVLLHELAHSLVARWKGIEVRSITLFLFGGLSRLAREAPSPGAELLIAAAGPLTSLVLAAACAGGALALERPPDPWSGMLGWLSATDRPRDVLAGLLFGLAGFNAVIGWFNLVPGFPLDGGRVLRSLIWYASEDYFWATQVAARWGQLAATGVVTAGLIIAFGQSGSLLNGLWLMLIGLFLLLAATNGYQAARLLQRLEGVLVGEVCRTDPRRIEADASAERLAELIEEQPGNDPTVVTDDRRPIGLVATANLRKLSAEQLARSRVRDLMRGTPEELLLPDDLPAGQALRTLLEYGFEYLPVVHGLELVGLLRRDDLFRLLELRRHLRGR